MAESDDHPARQPEATPRLRVSDAERERVVDLLAEHAAEGRLTLEELDERVDAAHAARTRGELAEVVADLPAGEAASAPADTPVAADTHRRRPAHRRLHSRQIQVFLAVNALLVAIWALTGAGYFWPIWPILGWGFGLVKVACLHRRSARARGDQPTRTSTSSSPAEAATLP